MSDSTQHGHDHAKHVVIKTPTDPAASDVKLTSDDQLEPSPGTRERKASTFEKQKTIVVGTSKWIWSELPKNIQSGISVSLVNVPLSISLAIASGASPIPGIVTAFWAGLVAAIFGGSEFNIVGPTGALSGLLTVAASTYGPSILPFMALWAGVITFVVWVFNLADYILFVPSSVIHGFTLGVAFIIGLNQMDFATGLLFKHEEKEFIFKLQESFEHLPDGSWVAFGFFAFQLALLLFLYKKRPTIPWPIIFSVFGIAIAMLHESDILPIELITLKDKFGHLHLDIFAFPEWNDNIFDGKVIGASFGVAFIVILETLISARMADDMTKTDHERDREVLGAGLANIICGIFGGIPATAALARTSLNVKSGATSRVSALIGCVFLLVISFVFLGFFEFIPLATVAAILCSIAIRMVETHHIVHLFRHDRRMFVILIFTALMCIAIDTMAGLVIGSLFSLLQYTKVLASGHCEIKLYKNKESLAMVDVDKLDESKLPMKIGPQLDDDFETDHLLTNTNDHPFPIAHRDKEIEPDNFPHNMANVLYYRMFGQLSYVNARGHTFRVKKLHVHSIHIKHVIFILRSILYIDLDGVDALKEMIEIYEANGTQVILAGIVHPQVKATLKDHDFYNRLEKEGKVYDAWQDVFNKLFPDS